MQSVPVWLNVLVDIVALSPLLLVFLIGAGLCARHLHDQRRRAVLVATALLIQFASVCASLWLTGPVIQLVERTGGPIELAVLAARLMHSLPAATALLLLLYAAFYANPRLRDGDADFEQR